MAPALFLSVLLIAACGLIYELVASALASYLLGDSVTQFSTVIGTYLFAMGVGSWLSRLHRARTGRAVHHDRAAGRARGRLLVHAPLPHLRLHASVPARALRAGRHPRHLRRPRDPAAHADPQGSLRRSRTSSRTSSPSTISARSPRRSPSRSSSCRSWVSCARRCCSGWSTPASRSGRCGSSATHLGARRMLAGACVAVLLLLSGGMVGAERITTVAENSIYSDDVIFARHDALSAHRADGVEGRPPALAQLAPAVQLARRVPLPRGAGAPGPRGATGGAARARPRRRRRARRARGAQASAAWRRSRWWTSIRR